MCKFVDGGFDELSNSYVSLVNNAGISVEARTPAMMHLTEEATWDTTMRVNTKSIFLGCKYALAQMMAQEPHSSGDRGWIVNISSIMGLVGGLRSRECALAREVNANLCSIGLCIEGCRG